MEKPTSAESRVRRVVRQNTVTRADRGPMHKQQRKCVCLKFIPFFLLQVRQRRVHLDVEKSGSTRRSQTYNTLFEATINQLVALGPNFVVHNDLAGHLTGVLRSFQIPLALNGFRAAIHFLIDARPKACTAATLGFAEPSCVTIINNEY